MLTTRQPLSPASPQARQRWVLALTSVASLMVGLDILVVTTALTTIRLRLGASIEELEWIINAYTLSFAVLLMTASALGDRFGRRRLFLTGLGLFTVMSAACALAPSVVSSSSSAEGMASLPDTEMPRASMIRAMPDMPAPPRPTKCTRPSWTAGTGSAAVISLLSIRLLSIWTATGALPVHDLDDRLGQPAVRVTAPERGGRL